MSGVTVLTATLQSMTPYSQSRHITTLKAGKEGFKDFEERTWKERLHVDENGWVFIPPMAFKNCVTEASKYLGMKIPGKQNATFTKHFEAGFFVLDGLTLPLKPEDIKGEWLYVPSDGKRGGSKRVDKCFPVIHEWKGDVAFHILDETLLSSCKDDDGQTMTVFEHHLREAGKFIGIGRFRPRNNGYYGRFNVLKVRETAI
jgi:hypothetical protein